MSRYPTLWAGGVRRRCRDEARHPVGPVRVFLGRRPALEPDGPPNFLETPSVYPGAYPVPLAPISEAEYEQLVGAA
jgi:hypothetical protein